MIHGISDGRKIMVTEVPDGNEIGLLNAFGRRVLPVRAWIELGLNVDDHKGTLFSVVVPKLEDGETPHLIIRPSDKTVEKYRRRKKK